MGGISFIETECNWSIYYLVGCLSKEIGIKDMGLARIDYTSWGRGGRKNSLCEIDKVIMDEVQEVSQAH